MKNYLLLCNYCAKKSIKNKSKEAMYWVLCFLLFVLRVEAEDPSTMKTRAKFSMLNPASLSQNLAFYELYADTREGKKALERVWQLLGYRESQERDLLRTWPSFCVDSLIYIVNKEKDVPLRLLSEEEWVSINALAENLHNRQLEGYQVWDIPGMQSLATEQVDLCRALLLEQYKKDPEARQKIRSYEAMVDMMAIQILANLSSTATDREKVSQISHFIFHEMGFRFPPHALWAKDIDLYTFLPSVLDSRQGVCLGVSILYLCIAQRLGVELEIITPPGHIYVRYRAEGEEELNIETTARGIHIPSDTYKGVETKQLQQRTMKQVVGLAFMNQASVAWRWERYQEAIELYEIALQYIPEDSALKTFLAYNYLFVGEVSKGKSLLEQCVLEPCLFTISDNTITQDYLLHKTDAESIKAVFMPVDETRESIMTKQNTLLGVVEQYPEFRAALLQLAGTYLQLGRYKEAIPILRAYYKIDPDDPVVHYYLAVIYLERYRYKHAWYFLKQAEQATHKQGHFPKALQQLRQALAKICPEAVVKDFSI
jgi:tetratricopeptide (TPR) repeat protein